MMQYIRRLEVLHKNSATAHRPIEKMSAEYEFKAEALRAVPKFVEALKLTANMIDSLCSQACEKLDEKICYCASCQARAMADKFSVIFSEKDR